MKAIKKIRFCLAGLVCAVMISTMTAGQTVHAEHAIPEEAFTQVPDSVIRYSPNVSAQEAFNNTVFYLQVPGNILARLQNDQVPIYLIAEQDEYLTSARLESFNTHKIRLAGLTTHPGYLKYIIPETNKLVRVERVRNGMIEIQTDVPPTQKMNPYRIIHEIAHYVDSAAGSGTGTLFAISSSKEWQAYYQKYGRQILKTSSYASVASLYDASECWADAFALAYSRPEVLEAISPDLLQYVALQALALPAVGSEIPAIRQ